MGDLFQSPPSSAVSTFIMKMAVFWDVAPCSSVQIYRCYRGACCFHHQGDDLPHCTSQHPTTVIFIFTAVITSNLTIFYYVHEKLDRTISLLQIQRTHQ
jgi:hypothetical protein